MLSRNIKGALKSAVGRMLFTLRLHSIFRAQQGVVVAFHRVNMVEDKSGLSVSPQKFEEFCRFFRRYFQVIPLSQFVERLQKRQTVGGMLAITFDDGYRDNYDVAAPILKRLSLPATFFVTTKYIETDVIPQWDREAGSAFPWMTWKEVRTLQEQGFEIGSHTRTHVDLGKITGISADEEIRGSKKDLEGRLGCPITLFAYPFGRADQMTETNRSAIQKAGFHCCCSCFGGSNTSVTNPFELRRITVSSWFRSPFEFAFEYFAGRI